MTPNHQTITKVLSALYEKIVFNVWINDTAAVGVRDIIKEKNKIFYTSSAFKI